MSDSKIGLKKFPPKADDHVHEDELAISAAVYSDPADELAEMRERYADLVRAAEQAMRQRNALWLIAAEYAPVRTADVVPLVDVQRSCDAIGPLFVPAWRVVPEVQPAEPDHWALPEGWHWVVDDHGDWAAESASAAVLWSGATGSTFAKLGAPDELHELVRRRNLSAKGGAR
jgi:hypothetical protein